LSTTTTLMVPVLFFFLRGNMLQRYTIFLSHPSHQEEIPVYRGGQVGLPLGNVKTAEVRKKERKKERIAKEKQEQKE